MIQALHSAARDKFVRALRVCVVFVSAFSAPASSAGTQEKDAATAIATKIRIEGYACRTPVAATRDKAHSRPGETAWVVDCDNATYRITLIPHRLSVIQILDVKN
jgi:hypothetical protein